MQEKTKAMVLASFAADSLALGVHWIYNTHVIDKKFGRVESFLKPQRPTYHPTKDLGEFTHYGDQALVLLESVCECSGFDLNDFAQRWQTWSENYDGYFDKATKETLENIASGKPPTRSGSGSDDLAGASRIAPLIYVYRDDPEKLIASARAQTSMTHNNSLVVQSAAFFAAVAYNVLAGAAPSAAIRETQKAEFAQDPFAEWNVCDSGGLSGRHSPYYQIPIRSQASFGRKCYGRRGLCRQRPDHRMGTRRPSGDRSHPSNLALTNEGLSANCQKA
jgi:ADP-ribosylglycohydrolase